MSGRVPARVAAITLLSALASGAAIGAAPASPAHANEPASAARANDAAARPAAAARPVRALSIAEFRALVQQQRGHVLVLNLWASWCVPCLKEIPELVRVQRQYANCGVRVFGLATDDPQEVPGAVAAMHAKYFAEYESYGRSEGAPDDYASVVDPAWNELMPTTYVLDAQGRVFRRLQGGKSAEEFARVVGEAAGCADVLEGSGVRRARS